MPARGTNECILLGGYFYYLFFFSTKGVVEGWALSYICHYSRSGIKVVRHDCQTSLVV